MTSPWCYLILLKNVAEMDSWGMILQGGSRPVAVAFNQAQDGRRKEWNLTDWNTLSALPLTPPWIMTFYSDGNDPKKTLGRLLNGSQLRIWHHGGALQLRDITIEQVRNKFVDRPNGFPDAGFANEIPLMPFSSNNFPWQTGLNAVRDELFKTQSLPLDQALAKLDEAWVRACAFFHLEGPAQKIIEALYPLYVDLRNSSYSGLQEADFQIAWQATTNDVNSALSGMGLSTSELKDLWGNVGNEQPKKNWLLAQACIGILEAMEQRALINQADDFLEKFKRLSTAYTAILNLPSAWTSPGLTDPEPS